MRIFVKNFFTLNSFVKRITAVKRHSQSDEVQARGEEREKRESPVGWTWYLQFHCRATITTFEANLSVNYGLNRPTNFSASHISPSTLKHVSTSWNHLKRQKIFLIPQIRSQVSSLSLQILVFYLNFLLQNTKKVLILLQSGRWTISSLHPVVLYLFEIKNDKNFLRLKKY